MMMLAALARGAGVVSRRALTLAPRSMGSYVAAGDPADPLLSHIPRERNYELLQQTGQDLNAMPVPAGSWQEHHAAKQALYAKLIGGSIAFLLLGTVYAWSTNTFVVEDIADETDVKIDPRPRGARVTADPLLDIEATTLALEAAAGLTLPA